MKILKILLVGIGVLFLVVGVTTVAVVSTKEFSICLDAEKNFKKVEDAMQEYEKAVIEGKESYDLAPYEYEIKTARQIKDQNEKGCAKLKSSGKLAMFVGIVMGLIGIVLIPVSFIIGRKRPLT